jgi:hypothetical protein
MAKSTHAKKPARKPAAAVKAAPAGMGLDVNDSPADDTQAVASSPAESAAPANVSTATAAAACKPTCPWHHAPTVSYSTKGPFTYHKCSVAGCDFRTKVLRKVGLPRGK